MSDIKFTEDYGRFAEKFFALTPWGEQSSYVYIPMIVACIGLFLTIGAGVMSMPKTDPITKVTEKRTQKHDIFKVIAYILLAITVISAMLYVFRYFFVYTPQYTKWLASLPPEARSLHLINTAVNALSGRRRHNDYHSGPGITLRF